MKRNHKWADMIRRWLDDDSLEVEYRCPGDYDWRDISGGTPTWHPNMEYRFKPKMIKVNGYEFPEPMRVAPAIRQDVWLTTITGAEPVQWSDNPVKEHWLKLGLIHDYKAAAEAHARALISLTEVRE